MNCTEEYNSTEDFTSSSGSETSNDDIHFEGPEKNLEIDFSVDLATHPRGCRELTRAQLDEILTEAKCQILSSASNESLDSYVLSESSLFVYPHKVIVKTCGTTTLLRCLPLLLKYTKDLGMEVNWLSYSRKNFIIPQHQSYPHTSFNAEVEYFEKTLPNPQYGSAHVIGPVTSDHWFVYVWDDCNKTMEETQDRTLHVLMQDLDASVASLFYGKSGKEMTTESGIGELCPTGQIDDWAFTPCGYSMNAIDDQEAYQTIHITPESHCSYASWETNAKPRSYSSLINMVIQIFKPKRFTMTMFADRGSLKELQHDPFKDHLIELGAAGSYKRICNNNTEFEGDYLCFVANWVRK